MMKKIETLTLSALMAASLMSCSVKEERDGCPCWLDIEVTACARHDDIVHLKGWHDGQAVIGDKVYLSDFPDIYEKKVPRGMIEYTAYCGINTSSLSGDTIVIQEGNQSDKLYAYKTTVWADGEHAYDRIVPHKQFATVTLKINEKTDNSTSITVTGRTAGFNVAEMAPVAGTFRYSADKQDDGLIVFRIPRQLDKELVLELSRSGKAFSSIQLGDLITKTGYDWTATDLEDIYISIDTTDLDSPVIVDVWKDGHEYDYKF